ncbi:DUF1090 domain-containing protein [Pseudorhodoferax sp. Leaf274]|uniref:DUF1090 domain-containing protein n=1 Tax=Pseudorhodoferax sp. Leaf274 TaxID=1736318 RepID=UPI0007027A82|nr:DUF1090 domain-containing protein [Pseudorhodoferax sp. Leaf274]KQP35671.1 hypothetical protein ASF44_20350 [Pseudorhodoferax sp. Leaf274]
MKSLAICASIALFCTLPATAAESPACAAKRSNIESQISEARARGRSQELRGLQRALNANKANCSDALLAREREERIAKAEREVAERESELREAERKGDKRKIARRADKLGEARSELAEARKPLQQ